MLRQVAERDELRPRIRHVNVRFYYATIFNCSLNDAPDPFWNIAFITPDSFSFYYRCAPDNLIFHLFFILTFAWQIHDFDKYLHNLFIERLTLVSMSLIRVVTAWDAGTSLFANHWLPRHRFHGSDINLCRRCRREESRTATKALNHSYPYWAYRFIHAQ